MVVCHGGEVREKFKKLVLHMNMQLKAWFHNEATGEDFAFSQAAVGI